MKYLLRTLILILLIDPLHSMAQDLDKILKLNAKASGGADKWAKIENVRIKLEISEPEYTVQGLYVATRDGNMRMDISFGGGPRLFSEGLYNGEAWKWSPLDEYQAEDKAAADALRHGIELPGRFFTLQDMAGRGAKVTLEGEVTDGDRQQWQLRVTLPDGYSRDYFIDQKSHLVVRERDHRAFHPDVDPTEIDIDTRFQGEHWIDDVLRFDRSDNTNAETGQWLGTTKVESIEHNVDIAEGYFKPGP